MAREGHCLSASEWSQRKVPYLVQAGHLSGEWTGMVGEVSGHMAQAEVL